jgi:hypothetical protein
MTEREEEKGGDFFHSPSSLTVFYAIVKKGGQL